ncbi:MAG TPA: hypothetical protein VMZ25_07765 [Terriglobales bacterium]|nr:hypothetical protein [Terriglobales bacterium]
MFSVVFVVLLGIVSAGLILGGVAFYFGLEAQHQMNQQFNNLINRPPRT